LWEVSLFALCTLIARRAIYNACTSRVVNEDLLANVSESSAEYGRYGQKRENGRKFNLLLYVKAEPSTADMAKTVKTAVNLTCFCM